MSLYRSASLSLLTSNKLFILSRQYASMDWFIPGAS